MSRRRRGQAVHGIVLLDKPAGLSSNQAMQRVRRILDAQKAGHTGNLDPFATGMLPVCLGEACKTAAFMLAADKRYRAVARLGEATSTGDPEGEQVMTCPVPDLAADDITGTLQRFVGDIEQVPPMFSALKHQGRPLYEWAREGVTIERKARQVTVHSLELVRWQAPELEFEVHCSKGTYVRTLAEDIASALGSCAHLIVLRRLSVEPFGHLPMVTLEALEEAVAEGDGARHLLPVDAGLTDWPMVRLDKSGAQDFEHGRAVAEPDGLTGWARVYGPRGRLLGLAEATGDGCLQPRRVMHLPPEPGIAPDDAN